MTLLRAERLVTPQWPCMQRQQHTDHWTRPSGTIK